MLFHVFGLPYSIGLYLLKHLVSMKLCEYLGSILSNKDSMLKLCRGLLSLVTYVQLSLANSHSCVPKLAIGSRAIVMSTRSISPVPLMPKLAISDLMNGMAYTVPTKSINYF